MSKSLCDIACAKLGSPLPPKVFVTVKLTDAEKKSTFTVTVTVAVPVHLPGSWYVKPR